jgi:hypothetical protein
VTRVAEKKKAEESRKKAKDQPDTEREQRPAPPPVKARPRAYRFDDWASI